MRFHTGQLCITSLRAKFNASKRFDTIVPVTPATRRRLFENCISFLCCFSSANASRMRSRPHEIFSSISQFVGRFTYKEASLLTDLFGCNLDQ